MYPGWIRHSRVGTMNGLVTALFPMLVLLFSALAWSEPDWFVGLRGMIVPLLGLVMFGMGVTLTADSFRYIFRRPVTLVLGVGLQYLLMPFAGWLLARLFGLSDALLVGMVLVGCSPGGTASNVICYLAQGNLALSITLTTISTFVAVLATPLLVWFYAGSYVPVPVAELLMSVFTMIIVPVVLGMLLQRMLPVWSALLRKIMPLVSMAAIALIISIIVALNQGQLEVVGAGLVFAVMLHNLAGLLGGYWLARCFGRDLRESRTLAIEVGMQNSGLAVALAVTYFSSAAALPGALFSLWHNLSGSLLAGWWGRRG